MIEWDEKMKNQKSDHMKHYFEKYMEQIKSIKKMIKASVKDGSATLSKTKNVNEEVEKMDKKAQLVESWLKDAVKLPQYTALLIENGFDDLEFIKEIKKEHLMEIGINKLGHQLRLLKCIKDLSDL